VLKKSKPFEQIEVKGLQKDKIRVFIAHTLRLEVDETKSLTEVIYRQSQGNIFYTMQMLEQLKREKLLYKSFNTLKWTWDIKKVASQTSLSDNVIDLIISKIQTLPSHLQNAICIASFLRSKFKVELLFEMMEREKCPLESQEELVKLLEVAVHADLLESAVGSISYRFSHDRIKQAAYSLVPPGKDLDRMRVRMGKSLMELSNSAVAEDWMIFVAANHLNSVPFHDLNPLEIIKLNLEAGETAIEKSAFLPASSYLRSALQELDKIDAPWQQHYSICLRLHRAAAEVQLCLGDLEEGNRICQIIFENVDEVMDYLPTSCALANGLGRHEKHAEALELSMKTLQLLGSFPSKNCVYHAIRALVKVRRKLKKKSDDGIMLLPTMTDENKLYSMSILSSMTVRAFLCNKMPIVLLCILKQILYTFEYGLCPDSCVGFSSYGLVLCGTFGDQEGGNRMGRISRELLKLTQATTKIESQVLFTIAVYIDAWVIPIHRVLLAFQRSYESGMKAGDLESVRTPNRASSGSMFHLH
jgi:predicted ATPase